MADEDLIGTIQRVTYYNYDTGYTVLKVAPTSDVTRSGADREGLVNVVGVMVEFMEGETVRFSGRWVEDGRYGLQFRAEHFTPLQPQSERGIVRYLQETIHGVGRVTAQRIYKHFGEATLSILEKEPERLRELKLKEKLIENTRRAFQQNRIERLTIVELQNYGITPYQARKIYAYYGPGAREILHTDPYQMADIEGIGFKRADQIARAVGIAHNSRQRVRAGLVYTVEQMTLEGHTCIPREMLITEGMRLLEIDDRGLVASALSEQIILGNLISEPLIINGAPIEMIYAPVFFHSEYGAARRLRDQQSTASRLQEHARGLDWPAFLKELSQQHALKLTQQQQSAVKAVFERKLSVLTGGPGTGKTTTLRMVINALEQAQFKYALASPTGRAAKRLNEATGREAKTIHRLLEFQPNARTFLRDEDMPLECDVLIIDESSMMDLVLFYNVLKALPPHAHLMLVGDVDQLPSVGAGNVLRDVR
jgi:exodeoxyribonuclease V alpha subunit